MQLLTLIFKTRNNPFVVLNSFMKMAIKLYGFWIEKYQFYWNFQMMDLWKKPLWRHFFAV